MAALLSMHVCIIPRASLWCMCLMNVDQPPHALQRLTPESCRFAVQADIINQINDYFGADYGIDTQWCDLFSEPPEQQEAMKLSRLRSGSLPTSPRGRKGALGGVGSLAAAVAAVQQQQQQWPAAGDRGATAGRSDARRRASATLQQLQGELADTDSDDESYSEQESGEGLLDLRVMASKPTGSPLPYQRFSTSTWVCLWMQHQQ